MNATYAGLSVLSMVGFGALGWVLATRRGRSAPGWAAAGAIFPPLLLALALMARRSDENQDPQPPSTSPS